MDRNRFDAVTRLFAITGSRRHALGALIGTTLLGLDMGDLAGKRKKKGKEKGKGTGGKRSDRGKRNGKRRDNNPRKKRQQHDKRHENGRGQQQDDGDTASQPTAAPDSGQEEVLKAAAAATNCCGTLGCSMPATGSNSYECTFAGQNLSGRTMDLVNFGKINGKKTNFSGANVSQSNFGDACLQESNFRGTDVSQTNFGNACLFKADFTGALNFDFQVNLSQALLCGTIMPDGTVSDRDCSRATPCCAQCEVDADCGSGSVCCSGQCRSGVCRAAADCATHPCTTKTCTNNTCVYKNQANGKPGTNCTTQCCNGVCCQAGQSCAAGTCSCIPNCAGKVCGPNGCGGTCGTCPANSTCNANGTACPCNSGFKQCGSSCIPNDQCCTNNEPGCPGQQTCCDEVCKATNTDPENCGSCGHACPANATCSAGECLCSEGFKLCGIQCITIDVCCTSGTPDSCPPDQTCCNGTCQECCGDDAGICPAAPECQVSTCTDGQCGTQNQGDGTTCDFDGGGDGSCENGDCVCPDPQVTCDGRCCLPLETCEANECVLPPSCYKVIAPGEAPSGIGRAGTTQCQNGSICDQTIEVVLTGAPENTGYDVYIDWDSVGSDESHKFVGTFTTDGDGNAIFQATVSIPGTCPTTVDNEIVPEGGSNHDHQFIQEGFVPCPYCPGG